MSVTVPLRSSVGCGRLRVRARRCRTSRVTVQRTSTPSSKNPSLKVSAHGPRRHGSPARSTWPMSHLHDIIHPFDNFRRREGGRRPKVGFLSFHARVPVRWVRAPFLKSTNFSASSSVGRTIGSGSTKQTTTSRVKKAPIPQRPDQAARARPAGSGRQGPPSVCWTSPSRPSSSSSLGTASEKAPRKSSGHSPSQRYAAADGGTVEHLAMASAPQHAREEAPRRASIFLRIDSDRCRFQQSTPERTRTSSTLPRCRPRTASRTIRSPASPTERAGSAARASPSARSRGRAQAPTPEPASSSSVRFTQAEPERASCVGEPVQVPPACPRLARGPARRSRGTMTSPFFPKTTTFPVPSSKASPCFLTRVSISLSSIIPSSRRASA